jgi:cellulose synthase operon protein C
VTTTDDVIALISAGKTPVEVLRLLTPEDDALLLARCAVVRSFDADLLEVLCDGLDPEIATAERMVEDRLAEPIPGTDGLYRLRASIRDQYAPPTGTISPQLRELSRKLVGYYDERDPLEALYHEFVVDRGAARERFERLYAEADERFDRARCRDLIDVLGERRVIVPELTELRNDYRSYLGARGFWVDDWFRTARFLEPSGVVAAIERLLTDRSSRILQLWGPGGMGKTMLLRWLVARRCVPKPHRIACARIDFDRIVAVAALREPWLVLLAIAEQLNEQLRDAPFNEVLSDHGAYLDLLRHRPRDLGAAASRTNVVDSREVETSHAADVRERVVAALAGLRPEEHVLIVLDTLEVALLLDDGIRDEEAILPLLRELGHLRDAATRVRFVLAGRYDLSKRIPAFRTVLPDAETHQLEGFTEEEAQAYLAEKRGLTDPAVVQAAAAVGRIQAMAAPPTRAAAAGPGIMPFRLALVADVVEERPDMTADEILEYEDVDLLYLIERVVERVEPEIQWLLRYGVVPRVLDLPFVAKVLAPVLEERMADQATTDTARDRVPHRRRETVPVWKRDVLRPGERLDVDKLWTRLRQYAGRASWVAVDDRNGEGVQFHPDVVNPMRRLIANDDKLPELQRGAIEYFERNAKETSSQWAMWMREAVYHRFQLEGPQAASYWSAQLADARGLPEARRILAEDLVGDSYREGGKARRWRGRKQLVSKATDIQARYELAWAEAQMARDEGRVTESAWAKPRQALQDVEHRHKELRRSVVPPAKLALVQAAIKLTFEGVGAARPSVQKALAGRLPRQDRLWILVEFGEALSSVNPGEGEQCLHEALRLATRAPALPQWRQRILQKLAEHYAAQDDLDKALEAAEEAARDRGGDAGSEAQLLLPELYLRRGEPTRALDRLGRAKKSGRLGTLETAAGEARALIARWQPQEARAVAAAALGSLLDGSATTGDPLRDQRLAAELTECCGTASSRLLDVDAAHQHLLNASSLWSECGETDAAFRVQLRRVGFQLRDLGEPAEASLMLAQAGPPLIMSGELRRQFALLESEIAARRGDGKGARARANAVLKEAERGPARPREVVAAAIVALSAGGHGDQQRLLKLIAQHLARIHPASARLVLLAPLRYCTTLRDPGPKLSEPIRRLVKIGSRPGARLTLDTAILRFWSAEVDRVLGHRQAAAAKLEGIRPKLTSHGRNAFALGAWLAAAARAGVAWQSLERREELQVARVAASETSPLVAAGVLIFAALLGGDTVPRLLDEAGVLLGRGVSSTGGLRARLYEALARAALAAGDAPEATARATQAVELYTKLGDQASADRVTKAIAEGGAPKPPSPQPADITPASKWPALVVSLEAADAKLRVRAEVGELSKAVSLPARAPLSSVVRKWESAGSLRYPVAKVFLEQWATLRGDMGRTLVAALAAGPERKRLDLRLRIKDPRLDQIPWELAQAPGGPKDKLLALEPRIRHLHRTNLDESSTSNEVRSLQATLNEITGAKLRVDGLLGPDTRSAMRAFEQEAGPAGAEPRDPSEWDIYSRLGRPQVLVVRPTVGHEELAYRGSTQGGTLLEYLYAERGFDSFVLESPPLGELRSAVRDLRPVYVHLVANLVERGGTVGLDLGASPQPLESGAKWTRGVRVTASALDGVLRGALPKPFVIIETPAPRNLYETANQLFLRNGFAAALFAFENARAVVGVGLARYWAQDMLHVTLLDGLARARTLGDAVRALRKLAHQGPGPGDPEHAMAFGGTALFSRRGDSRLPSPPRP